MFETVGDVSRRFIVTEILAAAAVNSVVPYEVLGEALGDVDRTIVQQAVNAAKLGLEKDHQRAVVAVANRGYRIVRPSEHLALAQHHQRKSRRQLRRSRSKVDHVDMSALTDGERAAVTLAATSLALQLDYMRRNDIRSKRIEAAVKVVQTESERSAEEISELKARLERLEKGA